MANHALINSLDGRKQNLLDFFSAVLQCGRRDRRKLFGRGDDSYPAIFTSENGGPAASTVRAQAGPTRSPVSERSPRRSCRRGRPCYETLAREGQARTPLFPGERSPPNPPGPFPRGGAMRIAWGASSEGFAQVTKNWPAPGRSMQSRPLETPTFPPSAVCQ